MNDQDIPTEVKRTLLGQEIQSYKNSRYLFQVRHRVLKALGAEEVEFVPVIQQLERCEKALDALNAELAALPAQP